MGLVMGKKHLLQCFREVLAKLLSIGEAVRCYETQIILCHGVWNYQVWGTVLHGPKRQLIRVRIRIVIELLRRDFS